MKPFLLKCQQVREVKNLHLFANRWWVQTLQHYALGIPEIILNSGVVTAAWLCNDNIRWLYIRMVQPMLVQYRQELQYLFHARTQFQFSEASLVQELFIQGTSTLDVFLNDIQILFVRVHHIYLTGILQIL